MHRAALRDLEQARALFARERTLEDELALDPIDQAFLGLTIRAVLRMDPVVRQADGDALERPLLAAGIETERHRSARTERREQQVIGRGTGIRAAGRDGFVRAQRMPAGPDVLGEATVALAHADQPFFADGRRCRKIARGPSRDDLGGIGRILARDEQMIRSIQRDEALGVLRGGVDTPRVIDVDDFVLRRMKDEKRLGELRDARGETLLGEILEKLPLDRERSTGDRDRRLSGALDRREVALEKRAHVAWVARRADRHDGPCLGDVRSRGEDGGSAQAVTDQEQRGRVLPAQELHRRNEVRDVGGEIRVHELALARAETREIEAQDREAPAHELPGHAGGGGAVLGAGETVGEEARGARRDRRTVEARGEELATGVGELNTRACARGSVVHRARFGWAERLSWERIRTGIILCSERFVREPLADPPDALQAMKLHRMRSQPLAPVLLSGFLLAAGACSKEESEPNPPGDAPAEPRGTAPGTALQKEPRPGQAAPPGRKAASSAQELYENGLSWARRGDNAQAVEEYRRAIALDPGFADAHFSLGTTLVPQSYVVIGSGVRDYQILDEALAHLRRAFELVPENAEYAYWLGRALDLRDQDDEAVAVLTRAIELDPKQGLAHKRLGLIHSERGEREEALASFRAALETLGDDPGIHFQIGNLLQEEDPEAARASYEKAIESDPTYPYAYHGLSTVLARLGDEAGSAKALEDGKRWKELDDMLQTKIKKASDSPNDIKPQIGAGDMLFAFQRWEDALQMYRRALALDQRDPYVHMCCGIILRELGDHEIAMNHLEESVFLAPEEIRPLVELARVYASMKNETRVDETLVKLQGVLKPDDLEGNLLAGDLFFELDRREDAARCYEAVLASEPANEAAREGLARAQGEEAQ